MSVRLFNTLSRRKEEFVPRVEGEVAMYVCGPTVYNYIHIGNARTFLSFDLIRRYLVWRGYKVTFAQNITDVDDKIINRAAEEGISPSDVAGKYDQAFKEQMAALGAESPTHAPKATETIPEMIELVERLIERGLAYQVDGDVYFGVRRFATYGKLSGRSLDDMRAGERVEIDVRKEDPMDFALWKSSKPGEPSWSSPWGEGRPGWHLECSAMSLKYLGRGFDIHGGAQDLIFPHHENEIAQSEGAWGEGEFCRYWLHAGLLNIDKEKMSKSLGNFLLLDEVLRRWNPAVIRMFMVATHYRSPLDFSEEGLREAATSLDRLQGLLERLEFTAGSGRPEDEGKGKILNEAASNALAAFTAAMDDDFNSAAALGVIFGLAKDVNLLTEGTDTVPPAASLLAARELVTQLLEVLGVRPETNKTALDAVALAELCAEVGVDSSGAGTEALVESLVKKRDLARAAKEWATSDDIRDGLAALGIELEDTPEGTRWRAVARG